MDGAINLFGISSCNYRQPGNESHVLARSCYVKTMTYIQLSEISQKTSPILKLVTAKSNFKTESNLKISD